MILLADWSTKTFLVPILPKKLLHCYLVSSVLWWIHALSAAMKRRQKFYGLQLNKAKVFAQLHECSVFSCNQMQYRFFLVPKKTFWIENTEQCDMIIALAISCPFTFQSSKPYPWCLDFRCSYFSWESRTFGDAHAFDITSTRNSLFSIFGEILIFSAINTNPMNFEEAPFC